MPWQADVSTDRRPDSIDVLRTADGFSFEEALAGVERLAVLLAASATLPDVVGAVAEACRQLPNEPAVSLGLVDDRANQLRLVALEGFDPLTLDEWGVIPLGSATPLTDALAAGEPLYVASREAMRLKYPHLAADALKSGRRRWAAVPLVSPTGPAGVIGLGWENDDEFTAAERLYLLTLAKLGGEAIRRVARDIERSTLVVRLAEASDRERIEIARDLHDHSVQGLAAVLIRLGALRHEVAPELAERLRGLERDVQSAVGALRDVIGDLHPPDMSGLELRAAILDFAAWLFGTDMNITVRGGGLLLDAEAARVVYRIVQEALSNVHRHAGASNVAVEIELRDGVLHVVVHDDGVGLPDATDPGAGHIGVRTMTERARQAGGSVEFATDRGAVVTVAIPLELPDRTQE